MKEKKVENLPFLQWSISQAKGFSIEENGLCRFEGTDLFSLNSKGDLCFSSYSARYQWDWEYYHVLMLRASHARNLVAVKECDQWKARYMYESDVLGLGKNPSQARAAALEKIYHFSSKAS